eukprot:GHVR01066362.1.p1 GENE.GHVR01066362.1~~GHVR01066362.1.p1  ORF type:complete len:107 (+),score=2.13 GHVR01066362.1:36-323(+)
MDKHLTFTKHVNQVIAKGNSRLYGITQYKRNGLNQQGLLKLYTTNVRSVITYAAPAWFPLLSETNVAKLERVQKLALKVIYPEFDSYAQKLENLF